LYKQVSNVLQKIGDAIAGENFLDRSSSRYLLQSL